eukprot:s3229_g4.t1
MQIWDPYFCKGTMVKHLADLGFHSVRNVNEDFYKVQQTGIPDHHVLLTNPPYSADHLERCLTFCVESTKPCLLLLPCWVAKKPYFLKLFGCRDNHIFFIAPLQKYNYTMPPDLVPESCKPSWVGDDGQTSPFQSCWYVYLPSPFKPATFFENLKCNMAKSGPFDCVLAKRLQSVKWKLKKTSAEIGLGRPEAECQDQKRKRKHQKRERRERPAVPGTWKKLAVAMDRFQSPRSSSAR